MINIRGADGAGVFAVMRGLDAVLGVNSCIGRIFISALENTNLLDLLVVESIFHSISFILLPIAEQFV